MQADSNPAAIESDPAGSPDSSQEAPAAGYTLQEAAARLGISVNTLRRKLEAGKVRGTRVERPQGYVWRVYLPADQRDGHPRSQQAGQEATQQSDSRLQQPATPTVLAQAELMGNLVAPLIQQAIAPLVEELAVTRVQLVTQAERMGRLEAEVDRLQAENLELTLRATSPAEIAPGRPADGVWRETAQQSTGSAPRTPWWRRWLSA